MMTAKYSHKDQRTFTRNGHKPFCLSSSGLKKVALTILLAFSLNSVVPFFAVYQSSAWAASDRAFAQRINSVFGDKILLCTSDGFQLVSATELLENPDLLARSLSAVGHGQYDCALCLLAAEGLRDFPLASLDLPTLLALQKAVFFYQQPSLHVRQAPWRHAPKRAPPSQYLA